MLIRFNIKNFLSFSTREDGTSEEFSMIAGKVSKKAEHLYDDGTIQLLKFAAIFGANAAGKSNLIKAMDFMKTTIMSGLSEGHEEKYCRIIPENKRKASYFALEVLLDNHYYSYGFEVLLSKSKIVSEWLIELLPNNKEKIVFTRDLEKQELEIKETLDSEPWVEYIENMKKENTKLLLTDIEWIQSMFHPDGEQIQIMKQVYEWIDRNLNMNYPNKRASHHFYMTKGKPVGDICQMVAAFGTGIRDYMLEEVPLIEFFEQLPSYIRDQLLSHIGSRKVDVNQAKSEKISLVESHKANRNQDSANEMFHYIVRNERDFYILSVGRENQLNCQKILFSHGEHNIYFRLEEESDGTIRVLDLLEIILGDENKTYVVDELDRCLHPGLTYKFIETFLQVTEHKKVQLIVTTHESRLMDFKLLRRDEIWFTNKKKTGESDIYSLEEYSERFDKKVDQAYLEGRYGGVPVFGAVNSIWEE